MRRPVLWLTIVAGFAAGLAAPPAIAQENGAAVQPRAPVYTLPPGSRPESDPEPQVQGPRVPGETAPRLIRPDAEPAAQEDVRQAQPPRIPPVEQAERQTRNAAADPRPALARDPDRRSPPAEVARQAAARLPATEPAGEIGAEAPPSDGSSPVPTEQAIATPPPEEGGPALPWWLIAAGAILLAAGGSWMWRRRGLAVEEAPVEPAVARPTPEPRPRPVPRAAAVPPRPSAPQGPPATLAAPVRLHVDFHPSAARLTPMGFTIRYRVRLSNIGVQPANSIAIDMGVRAADSNAAHDSATQLETRFEVEALPVGALEEHEGEIRLPTQAFKAFQVDQRMLLFPIVDLAVRHGGPGKETVMSASFLIGQEQSPPTSKMAPFRLDKGLGQYKAVGGRRIELSAAA